MLKNMSSAWVKMCIATLFCIMWRMFPFRPPNVEPLLATLMPFGRRYGAVIGLLLAVLNVLAYDLLTGTVSSWTAVVAVTYGFIGLASGLLKGKEGALWYVGYAVAATLFFDLVTGVLAGWLLFGMPFRSGLVGQIPFTVNHLIGNVILAVALSPLMDWLVVRNPALEGEAFFGKGRRKSTAYRL
jgi:hypothetical protein